MNRPQHTHTNKQVTAYKPSLIAHALCSLFVHSFFLFFSLFLSLWYFASGKHSTWIGLGVDVSGGDAPTATASKEVPPQCLHVDATAQVPNHHSLFFTISLSLFFFKNFFMACTS